MTTPRDDRRAAATRRGEVYQVQSFRRSDNVPKKSIRASAITRITLQSSVGSVEGSPSATPPQKKPRSVRSAVSLEHRLVTDRQTDSADTQTHRHTGTPCFKKGRHGTHGGCSCANFQPIFKIFALSDSPVNLRQRVYYY